MLTQSGAKDDTRKKHGGSKDDKPRRQALDNKKDEESDGDEDDRYLPPKIPEPKGCMNMISLSVKIISGVMAGGGTEPTYRKAHVVEAKSAPKRMEVNSAASKLKAGKLKKVNMNTLVPGFSRMEFKGILAPHDDALIISTRVHGYDVSRILMDGSSS